MADPDTSSYPPDWQSLYDSIQAEANMPGVMSASFAVPGRAIFRGMYLDLREIEEQVAAAPERPPIVAVYCDVLAIPAGLTVALSGGALVIVARRIEAGDGAVVALDYTANQAATVAVYTAETAGTLQAVATVAGGNPTRFSLWPASGQLGVLVRYAGGAPVSTPEAALQPAMLHDGVDGAPSDLNLCLISIFQYATVLFSAVESEVAGYQLQWIQTCAGPSAAMQSLFLQASALLSLLRAASSGTSVVPFLSSAVYEKAAGAFVEAATAFESQYQIFASDKKSVEARVDAANVMLGAQTDQTKYYATLIAQCQTNFTNATLALVAAKSNFSNQSTTVELARVAFSDGLDVWKYNAKVALAFAILTATVKFVAAAGAMLATAGADAPAAGEAAAAAGEAANAAKAAEAAAGVAKNMSEIFSKIKDITEALNTTVEAANAMSEAVSNFKSGVSLDPADLATLAAAASSSCDPSTSWDVFLVQADAYLDQAVNAAPAIDGAVEYQTAVRILVIYAKAQAACELAVVATGQELQRLVLEQQVAVAQQARLQAYVKALGDELAPDDAMMQMFYQRYVDRKRWLFVELQNYVLAYYYQALTPSTVTPSITDDVGQMASDLSQIQIDYLNALQAFYPQQPQVLAGESVTLPASALASLKATQKALFALEQDQVELLPFQRIRFDCVRVYLDGAVTGNASGELTVHIGSSGIYGDRYGGDTYSFSGAPVQRAFVYRPANGSIVLDGQAPVGAQDAYFQPTPFSQWTIDLSGRGNAGLDLSKVTSVRLWFSGTALYREAHLKFFKALRG
jgi:hypothetical protein